MAEGMSHALATQLRAYGIGLLLGLTAIGYLQAVNTLMGPFMVILFGTGVVMVPLLSGVLRESLDSFVRLAKVMAAVLTVAAATWGITLWLLLPYGLGQVLIGGIWRPTHNLVLLVSLTLMGSAAAGGAGRALHALGAAKRSLRAGVMTSTLVVVLSVVGAAAGGLPAAILCSAAGTWIGVLFSWRELRAEVRSVREARGAASTGPARDLTYGEQLPEA